MWGGRLNKSTLLYSKRKHRARGLPPTDPGDVVEMPAVCTGIPAEARGSPLPLGRGAAPKVQARTLQPLVHAPLHQRARGGYGRRGRAPRAQRGAGGTKKGRMMARAPMATSHGHARCLLLSPQGSESGHGRNEIQRVGRKHTKMVSISVSLSTPRPSVSDLEENVKRIRAGLEQRAELSPAPALVGFAGGSDGCAPGHLNHSRDRPPVVCHATSVLGATPSPDGVQQLRVSLIRWPDWGIAATGQQPGAAHGRKEPGSRPPSSLLF